MLVETPPEKELDVINGNFVVRDLPSSGHQAHSSHRHDGRLAAQARCEPFDECLGVHLAVPTEWVQELSAEQGFGGGDVQERVGTFFAPPTARTHADLTCEGSHHVQGQAGSEKKWCRLLFNKSLEHKRRHVESILTVHDAHGWNRLADAYALCSSSASGPEVPGRQVGCQVTSTFTFLVMSTSQVSGHLPDHHRVESFSRPEASRVKIRCSSHNTFLPLCLRDTRRWVVKRTTESRVGERASCMCFLTPTCDGIPEWAHRHSILKWHFSAHVVTRPSLAECLFLEQTHGHSQCASPVCFYVLSQLLHEFCIPILLLHQLCIPSNRADSVVLVPHTTQFKRHARRTDVHLAVEIQALLPLQDMPTS